MSNGEPWSVGDDAELEAGIDVAAQLLRRYDPASGSWSVPRTGDFWETVADARHSGLRGAGATVAVIDSAFDTSLPALSTHSQDGDDPGHSSHGTVVALLVREVAPEADLLLYTVTREGRPDVDLVTAAIRSAVAEGADVINLSLGWPVVLPEEIREGFSVSLVTDWRSVLAIPDHPVLRAVSDAVRAGVVVVAACGNRADDVLIPAVHADALAVGFLTVLELAPGELTGVAPKGYQQSNFADIKLVQPPHVLGSSFASPLIAGFAALVPQRSELRAYARSAAIAALASDLMIGWDETTWNDTAATIDDWFKQALLTLPHVHSATDRPCAVCALLATPGYLNWGLWKLRWSDFDGAATLFRAVTAFAPSNAIARANLEVTLAAMAARRYGRAMTELRIRIDEADELEQVQSWADANEDASYEVVTEGEGAELAIAPVVGVLIGAGVAALAVFIRDWIEKGKGGTVVDLRKDATDQVYRDKDLNYGWLMVITADGKVSVEVKDAPKDTIERLIEQVISGAFKTVSDVAGAAKEALGGDKVKPEAV